MTTLNVKTCNGCKLVKSVEEFPTLKTAGVIRFRYMCRKCFNSYTHNLKKKAGKTYGAPQKRYNAKVKAWRQQGEQVPRWILQDSRQSDKKSGLLNDLDMIFIEEKIKLPCAYCGDTSLRKTLDRIDNTKGHLKSNVETACIRCNYLRRDMPYPAWIELSKSLEKIRLLGLFESWIPSTARKVKNTGH